MNKILYVSPNGYLGGAEKVVLSLAHSHLKEGRYSPVILFFSHGEAVDEARKLGVPVIVLKTALKLSRPYELLKAIKEIRGILQDEKPLLTHHTMAYAHLVMSLATSGLKNKSVWFQHGPVGGKLDKLASLFPCDMIFFNSDYLKTLHHHSCSAKRVRLSEAVIRLGVFSSNDPHPLFSGPVITLGTAGRICEGKAFHHILEALGEIKKEGKHRPFELLIAGSAKTPHDQLYFDRLIELAQTLNLQSEVVFLKHQEDMKSFYHKLDIFIHSSTTPEPFGLVLAEAMGEGCLTIGQSSGGSADFLKTNVTGIAITTNETVPVLALEKKIRELLDPGIKINELRMIANQGRQFIQKNYSLEGMRDQVESLYDQILLS